MEGQKIIKNPFQFFLSLYAVGIIGHLLEITRPIMIIITPYFLVINAVLLLFLIYPMEDKKLFFYLIFVYLNTFILEVLGVATQKIFGPYHYGQTLGLKFLEVPLIIGLNWTLIILGGLRIAQQYFKNSIMRSLFVGLFAVGIDFFIEPVAIFLDYWTWTSSSIPLQNYIVWFLTAFFNALLFFVLKIKLKSTLPAKLSLIQFAFFFCLNLAFRWL